jgi:hypothetical protein
MGRANTAVTFAAAVAKLNQRQNTEPEASDAAVAANSVTWPKCNSTQNSISNYFAPLEGHNWRASMTALPPSGIGGWGDRGRAGLSRENRPFLYRIGLCSTIGCLNPGRRRWNEPPEFV